MNSIGAALIAQHPRALLPTLLPIYYGVRCVLTRSGTVGSTLEAGKRVALVVACAGLGVAYFSSIVAG